jgi:hypothetical protein
MFPGNTLAKKPPKEKDWSKCVIYQITCKDPAVKSSYVGHTIDIYNRTSRHKTNANNAEMVGAKTKLYETIRNNGGWDNWKVMICEDYKECTCKDEARIRERMWTDKLNTDLNMNRAHATKEENKESVKKAIKTYQATDNGKQKTREAIIRYQAKDENKEKLREWSREYWKKHPDMYEKLKERGRKRYAELKAIKEGQKVLERMLNEKALRDMMREVTDEEIEAQIDVQIDNEFSDRLEAEMDQLIFLKQNE